ncbi:MAG: hypothetical protein AAF289_16595 [Cyanobacteria bacterium P01_A01_bin.135]
MNAIASLFKSIQGLVIALMVGVLLVGPAAAASAETQPIAGVEQTAEIAAMPQVLPDLQRAILSAEAASLAIFNGLEMTQDFVGKTERRKAAIEHGRNHASDRLKALVERARSAKSYSDLSPTDRLVLKRLLGS